MLSRSLVSYCSRSLTRLHELKVGGEGSSMPFLLAVLGTGLDVLEWLGEGLEEVVRGMDGEGELSGVESAAGRKSKDV